MRVARPLTWAACAQRTAGAYRVAVASPYREGATAAWAALEREAYVVELAGMVRSLHGTLMAERADLRGLLEGIGEEQLQGDVQPLDQDQAEGECQDGGENQPSAGRSASVHSRVPSGSELW